MGIQKTDGEVQNWKSIAFFV